PITITATGGAPVATVTIAPATATVAAGQTSQLTAMTKDGAGAVITGRAVAWATSNAALATVSSTGLVTGVAVGGPVTITATSEGQNGTAAITVTVAPLAFTQQWSGYTESCGIVASGAAYCWGQGNGAGQSKPVALAGGIAFSAMALGNNFTCGL